MLLVRWHGGRSEEWVPVEAVAHCTAVLQYFNNANAAGSRGGSRNSFVNTPIDPVSQGVSALGDTERHELAMQLAALRKRIGTAPTSREYLQCIGNHRLQT